MRMKICEDIFNHFMNGNGPFEYDKDITLMDGTVVTPAMLYARNTDTSIYRGLFTTTTYDRVGACMNGAISEVNNFIFPLCLSYINYESNNSSTGNLQKKSYEYAKTQKYSIYNNQPQSTIFFGSGTTPPTDSDIELESPADMVWVYNRRSDFSLTQTNPHICLTIYNGSGAEVTLTEMGVFKTPICASLNAYSPTNDANIGATSCYLLVQRDLIDPITIPAGEYGSIYIYNK